MNMNTDLGLSGQSGPTSSNHGVEKSPVAIHDGRTVTKNGSKSDGSQFPKLDKILTKVLDTLMKPLLGEMNRVALNFAAPLVKLASFNSPAHLRPRQMINWQKERT